MYMLHKNTITIILSKLDGSVSPIQKYKDYFKGFSFIGFIGLKCTCIPNNFHEFHIRISRLLDFIHTNLEDIRKGWLFIVLL